MKIFTGTVVKIGDKTAKVELSRVKAHSLYEKRLRISKYYLVHDEVGVKEGDKVRFSESPPISKRKRWRIVEKIS